MKPYSLDLRKRVVWAVERHGLPSRDVAARFGVATKTVTAWVRLFRETGTLEPGRVGGHRRRAIRDEHRDWLLRRCQEGEFTLRGLVIELSERGLKVDYHSVWRFVRAEKLRLGTPARRRRTPD